MCSSDDPVTDRTIAEDLVDYLRENPRVCADVSIHAGNHPWVRYVDGEWQLARYGEMNRVEGKVIEEGRVVRLFANNPVRLSPTSEAYRWRPADTTVWEDADNQDVFSDANRCVWCGYSERKKDLTRYETTEDGECLLCQDCHEDWDDADQIVATAQEVGA